MKTSAVQDWYTLHALACPKMPCHCYRFDQLESVYCMESAGTVTSKLGTRLYPGLLTSVFVACSTNISTVSDKHWGENTWVQGWLHCKVVPCNSLHHANTRTPSRDGMHTLSSCSSVWSASWGDILLCRCLHMRANRLCVAILICPSSSVFLAAMVWILIHSDSLEGGEMEKGKLGSDLPAVFVQTTT